MAKKGPVDLPWHPDFRDLPSLPDIKVVRSAFFINFGSLALAVILLCYWIFVEYQLATVRSLIAEDQQQISFLSKNNKELLTQSAEFERWAKLINEIQGFVSVPFRPSDFLSAIGEARPANMTMSSLAYVVSSRTEPAKETRGKKAAPVSYPVWTITLSGSLSGTSAQATRSIEAFRDNLPSLPIFKSLKLVSPPILKQLERDRTLDLHTFTLQLEVRP
jgi:hypothetical protein